MRSEVSRGSVSERDILRVVKCVTNRAVAARSAIKKIADSRLSEGGLRPGRTAARHAVRQGLGRPRAALHGSGSALVLVFVRGQLAALAAMEHRPPDARSRALGRRAGQQLLLLRPQLLRSAGQSGAHRGRNTVWRRLYLGSGER